MNPPDAPQSDPSDPPESEEARAQGPSYDTSLENYAGISSTGIENIEGLQEAKNFAEMIVDTVREGLLILDLDLDVKAANETFYKTFNTAPEEAVGRSVYELGNGQWDMPELRKLLESILPENKVFNDFKVDHEFEGIGRRVMLLNARQLDRHQLILLAIEDVTERQEHEQKLAESRERFDLFVENAKEYAIFMMDEDGIISLWNPGAQRVLGWREDEIVGQKGDVIFTEEDREAGVPEQEMAQAQSEETAKDDRWHIRKDGSRFWATGFLVALHAEDGELRGFTKIIRDDTDQKEAEEERKALVAALEQERADLRELNETLEERVTQRTRQVRELASMLTMAEQQERRRVSQILHDNLQQQLYGIQLKMSFIRQEIEAGNQQEALSHLAQGEAWIAQGVDITRNLAVDLSPPILRSEGLADTLSWLQAQMKQQHDLEVELDAPKSFKTPEEDMRVLLFQIVRELLFNVAKHAGTNRAHVELRGINHHIEIVVADEGKGFDVAAAEEEGMAKGGFGLFSVRERLNLFGGHMQIASAPGEGTRVTVDVPLQLE